MEPYFVCTYSVRELQQNLNALVEQGYEIAQIMSGGFFQDEALIVVIAKKRIK